MSDNLTLVDRNKIKWNLAISTEFPLQYVKQQVAQQSDVLFCVEIPWPLLCLYSEILENKNISATYIDLLNSTLDECWFNVKKDCIRIENLLYKNATVVKQACRKAKGRKKEHLNSKLYKLSIRRSEIETVEKFKSEIEECKNEMEDWKKKYSDIKTEKEELYQAMKEEVNNLQKEIVDLQNVNKEMASYVEILERNNFVNCQGKKINELGPKQQRRKLHTLANRAQCGLWFCESFGLHLKAIEFNDERGNLHKMKVPDTSTPYNSPSHEQLPDPDKQKLEKILFLLDKFCVSDEAYHELVIEGDGLPKSYLIKQKRGEMNNICHVERIPGKYPGAALNFTSTLQSHIRDLLETKPELKGNKIQVKLSGDGARMSRTTNFMMMSFTMLQLEEKVMSSKHNRTVLIIDGPEEYETLKSGLSKFCSEVNELINNGSMLIDGENVDLEFFLGGDMKFLLMMLGINNATSNYACLYCKVHKDNRWDTSKPMYYYNEEPMVRTLEEIKQLHCTKDNFGCINSPLLDIPLTHIIPDELHLLLRVTDRLLQNVVDEVMERDAEEDFGKPNSEPKKLFLSRLVDSINKLGIPFSIWNKRNADGTESQEKEFTSLLGSQKKKILTDLPIHMHEFLYPDTCATVKKIWIDFGQVYRKVSDFNLDSSASHEIFNAAKSWIDTFCSLRGIRPGYIKPRVTPYMHILTYHIPIFVEKHGCLKKFTGQGVEQNNDEAKRIMFQKSNKWDAAKDILLSENRQWSLKHLERVKRPYTKRKLEYWGSEISNTRQQKRQKCREVETSDGEALATSVASDVEQNVANLTVKQLREMIKGKGLKPKGFAKLKKHQLIELIEKS